MMGTSIQTYKDWAHAHELPVTIEEVATGTDTSSKKARVLWIGPKKLNRVILYLHGGAFLVPLQHVSISFWRCVQLSLKEKSGMDTGVAILDYSLYPGSPFPTQLLQAKAAVKYLIDSGAQPCNIQLAGDDSGAYILLKLLTELIRPNSSIRLAQPIGSVYLMSPWVPFNHDGDRSPSFSENDNMDVITTQTLAKWGRYTSRDFPKPPSPAQAVVESVRKGRKRDSLPCHQFLGVANAVQRVLITVGKNECLRDDVVRVVDQLRKNHPLVRFILQGDGVHNDPYLDLLAGEREGKLMVVIMNWFAEVFRNEIV
ncbi:alpha/beta-hydrolase [Dendrothele bispora CBS 962.96]|uniref:Alpha/beta-hydrolase n=1 Tax=Dendrothele bispora (strain CBS 962.96) TaxID=1314807 RepID=A0A4S8LR83_DENBC|nr:alpha/beta-hydrolase [Dendrothele bispora CBS 962.96]